MSATETLKFDNLPIWGKWMYFCNMIKKHKIQIAFINIIWPSSKALTAGVVVQPRLVKSLSGLQVLFRCSIIDYAIDVSAISFLIFCLGCHNNQGKI